VDLCIAPKPLKQQPVNPQPRPQPPAPPQPQPADSVQVTSYLQDPWVAGLEQRPLAKELIGTELKSERVQTKDSRPLVKPDAQGNFLMEPGSNGDAQVNAHVGTVRTLAMWEQYRGGSFDWSFFDPILDVVAHKREGMNAYYSRWEGSTNYFFSNSPQLNTTVKTAHSLDIVSHETGHAMLDGMKPGYLSAFSKETSAFHEAFGDCMAMLATLQDPLMNDRIIAETGGDLRQQSILPHLAEEFGMARKLANSDPADDQKPWLRNSLNKFTYVPPETLGDGRGDDDTLGGEIHSFGRLFAGAFYDCLEAAYKQGCEQQQLPPAQALKYAADTLGPVLARGVELAPANRGHFKDIGLGMRTAAQQLNNPELSAAIEKVFLDRKIISADDVQQDEQRRHSLPQLQLDRDFHSKSEATAWIAAQAGKLGIPQDAQAVALSRNERGEQTVSMLYPRTVPVNVPGLEGLTTELQGGVTLVFDSAGKLSEFRHDPPRVEEEMQGIAYLQRKEQILDGSDTMIFTRDDGKPYQAAIRGDKLVRVPSSSCDCGENH
jgi:hypothetical protein